MRIGDSHGLMRALDARGRLRPDDFAADFAPDELYPPDVGDGLARTPRYLAYVREAGLVHDNRGILELTDAGRRYIRAGRPDRPFEVAPAQAELLRELGIRE